MISTDGTATPRTYLFDVSRIPAKALYHAKNAARRPKEPPALMRPGFGAPAAVRFRYPQNNNRNVMSRVKKSKKKATVERRVAINKRVVKMNQACQRKLVAKIDGATGD